MPTETPTQKDRGLVPLLMVVGGILFAISILVAIAFNERNNANGRRVQPEEEDNRVWEFDNDDFDDYDDYE